MFAHAGYACFPDSSAIASAFSAAPSSGAVYFTSTECSWNTALVATKFSIGCPNGWSAKLCGSSGCTTDNVTLVFSSNYALLTIKFGRPAWQVWPLVSTSNKTTKSFQAVLWNSFYPLAQNLSFSSTLTAVTSMSVPAPTYNLISPRGLCQHPNGTVFLANSGTQRIIAYSLSSAVPTQIYGFGSDLPVPTSIAWDPVNATLLFVTGNDRINVVDCSGGLASCHMTRYFGSLYHSSGIAVSENEVFASETQAYTVKVPGASTCSLLLFVCSRRCSTFAPQAYDWFGQNMRTVISATLYSPDGIFLDSHGLLWIADNYNNQIQCFTQQGAFVRKWGGVTRPVGIHVPTNDYVVIVEYTACLVKIFAPGAVVASATYGTGSCNSEPDSISNPYGVFAVDTGSMDRTVTGQGYNSTIVLIGDSMNNRLIYTLIRW